MESNHSPQTHEIHYVNTDLDLEASADLTPLAEVLVQRGLLALHVHKWEDGLWTARFETEEPFEEPDQNIAAMLTVIESLEEPFRRLWEACTIRNFDIGYESGNEPRAFIQQITTTTLARMVAAGTDIKITLYPL